jgi:thioredoxin 2
MTSEATHIVCPHCDSVNRIPAGKSAAAAKCGVCHKSLFTGHPFAATTKSFDRQVSRNDIPVVVDFWADWCGPCKMMAPAYEQVAAESEPAMRFLKLDTEVWPDVSAHFGIKSIPTLIVFRKGKILAQRAGAMDAATLRRWLRDETTEYA